MSSCKKRLIGEYLIAIAIACCVVWLILMLVCDKTMECPECHSRCREVHPQNAWVLCPKCLYKFQEPKEKTHED